MIHRKYRIAAIFLGLATLLGGDRLSAADPVKKQSDDARTSMEADGWTQISEGVFERRLGDKVEHLGFGREGLSWTIGEMNRRLEILREEQESYPSEKLNRVIDHLTARIAGAKSDLWKLDQNRNEVEGMSMMTEAVTGASCSSICYSATADAYPLTSSQGVGAAAEAKFNSACGYSGNTYAYAYARATQGTVTTTKTQEDPRTGSNIISSASASWSGSLDCYSEAYATVSSSDLGISYSTSDANYSCPAQPCTVAITGTSYEFYSTTGCRSRTWTANVSGCTPSTYEWKWNGTVVGTGNTYTRSLCASNATHTLEVTVNGSAYDSHAVTLEYEPYDPECGVSKICPE